MSSTITSTLYSEFDKLNIQDLKNESCHYCTTKYTDISLDSFKDENVITPKPTTSAADNRSYSLKICENYKPSYTSKKDQINVISDRIKMVRQSKQAMKDTMKAIDNILDEKYKNNDNKNKEFDLDEFFKSKRCLSGSLNVSSLNSNLPRKDINPPKYINEVNKTKTEKADKLNSDLLSSLSVHAYPYLLPTSLFEPYNEDTFTDTTILENRKKVLEHRKRNNQLNNKRVLSAGYSLVRNGIRSNSDRSASAHKKHNKYHQHCFDTNNSPIYSAHK